MFLKQIKLPDLDTNKKYPVLVPIGSTEQHGPYLPFGSDTYMTDALVEEINRQFPHILILPTLEVSCSKEHEGFPGTVWLEEKTLKFVFYDICASIENIASSIIFFTEHGGNLHVIREFIQEQSKSFHGVPLHHLLGDDAIIDQVASEIIRGPVDSHAGNSEISIVLSIRADLVTIPKKSDPKIPVIWKSEKLKDDSLDGIADPHSEWMVSRELGDRLLQVMKDTTIDHLKKILDDLGVD